ncbi:glycerate kinase [Pelosinus sp. IPA-1]|uniref:glycerate kinase n=1 Tax=Pelosinus sp. IPA-1 TaxID=3029569 RepID=UPI0024361AEC|nr:glycerate kinase [Pelosinus sp. IPA-1]GMB01033.1 glycerate kinase [Pelosinus sp. IPA-1]
MRIVVAPDSYKGSVSAVGTANAMEKGIKAVFPEAEVVKVPIADGGEGTVEALVTATNGQIIYQDVVDPLGCTISSYWGILGDGKTAVIEMAAASGLPLVPNEKRNPRVTTTYGTGQLIKAALDRGLKKIIIGIGGSATNDGGCGMAQALGGKFLDADGQELSFGGAALAKLNKVDLSDMDARLGSTVIIVACDVDNPLCGPKGATAVYGPQKGASPEMVIELDAALKNFASKVGEATGKNIAEHPGAGAAGGLGAGLLFFTNAVLRPGVEIVLETTGFESLVKSAQLVITGEGRTDFQTAFGKAPVGVAKLAKKYNVSTICLSGGLGQGYEDVLKQGIDGLMSTVPCPMTLEECIEHGAEFIEMGTKRLCQVIKVGMEI